MTDGGHKLHIRRRYNSSILVLHNIDMFINLITSMNVTRETTLGVTRTYDVLIEIAYRGLK